MSNVKQLTREEFGAMPKGESWNHIGELNEMIDELTRERDELKLKLKKEWEEHAL